MALLDEAMTVALGGESRDPLACGDACCTTLVVCDGLADLNRAAQWCEAVVEFTERRRYTPVQSWCRGIYGAVLVRAGEWERAEAVLAEGLRRHADRRKGGGHALPLAVLAELRLRQGRSEEAERLLTGLDDQAAALGPLVELHVQRGDLTLAQALLDRRSDADGDDGQVLVLRGTVALAARDLDVAAAAAERLRERAEELAREDLRGQAAMLAGRVAAARGDAMTAARELREAVDRFATLRFPLEEARARLALGEAQAACDSPSASRARASSSGNRSVAKRSTASLSSRAAVMASPRAAATLPASIAAWPRRSSRASSSARSRRRSAAAAATSRSRAARATVPRSTRTWPSSPSASERRSRRACARVRSPR